MGKDVWKDGKVRKFLVKTKPFQKYQIAATLFITLLITAFPKALPEMWAYYIGNLIAFSLINTCYRELYEAYIRYKCMWQKSCIWGLGAFCTINMISLGLVGTYNIYTQVFKILGLLTAIGFAIYYYKQEELN